MTQEVSITNSGKKSYISPFFIFLGFFWNDIINYSIPTPIGSSLMFVDILFFASLLFWFLEFPFFTKQKQVLFLYVVILIYIAIGFMQFGMKALSDCRQYYHFFFLFLGFAQAKRVRDGDFIKFLYSIILSLAIGSFLLFLLEIFIGHSFGFAIMQSEEAEYGLLEDKRGIRILGSTETFNLCLFIIFYLFFKKDFKSPLPRVIAFIFLVAVLFTQNRTPIIAGFIGYMIVTLYSMRIRKGRAYLLFLNICLIGVAFVTIYLLDYYGVFPLFSSLKSAVSVKNDEIGTTAFRLLGALGGLEIFYRNIFLGQGLGKGWQLDYGFAVLNIAPHNQYVSILAKFGLLGFGALVVWIVNFFSSSKLVKIDSNHRLLTRFSLVLLISQIPYGFGYDFHPFLPYFFGILLTRFFKYNATHEENTPNHSDI